MANIVRCNLPSGVQRFQPFTVADYRDFLLVRNDMNSKTLEEQKEIMNELLADYFHEYPPSWRPYIFLKVFTSSIGKTRLPVVWECAKCKKTVKSPLNLSHDGLKNPSIEVAGVKITFNFPDQITDDHVSMIKDNIAEVSDGVNTYKWEALTDDMKLKIIDAIDIKSFESVIEQMTPISITLNLSCCDKHVIKYDSILEIFKLIIHPDEVFNFYQINHVLVKHNYDLNSVMRMIPVERSIALSLIEKDNKK